MAAKDDKNWDWNDGANTDRMGDALVRELILKHLLDDIAGFEAERDELLERHTEMRLSDDVKGTAASTKRLREIDLDIEARERMIRVLTTMVCPDPV